MMRLPRPSLATAIMVRQAPSRHSPFQAPSSCGSACCGPSPEAWLRPASSRRPCAAPPGSICARLRARPDPAAAEFLLPIPAPPNKKAWPSNHDWMAKLSYWAEQELEAGTQRLLDQAVPEVERILIRVALRKADGLKQDAAKLLGWGRNTLTRKMKELGMEDVA